MKSRTGLALALVACTAHACAAHVPLPAAPDGNAPFEARARYYRQYRPVQTGGILRTSLNAWGMVTSQQASIDHVVLADGTTVSDPEDLVQMVGPHSPTAAAATRASDAQGLANGLIWGGVAASVVGVVLVLASFSATRDYDEGPSPLLWGGLGLGLAGSITTMVGRWSAAPAASSAREAAYQSLDGALRARMALCGDDRTIHDCNAPPAPTPAPGAWPPMPAAPALPPPPPALPTSAAGATTL